MIWRNCELLKNTIHDVEFQQLNMTGFLFDFESTKIKKIVNYVNVCSFFDTLISITNSMVFYYNDFYKTINILIANIYLHLDCCQRQTAPNYSGICN